MKSKARKIQKGYNANLVLLDKNPLEDIGNTKTINVVIFYGKVLERTLLDNILNEVKKADDASRKKDISKFIN